MFELDPWNPYSGRRELTSPSFLAASGYLLSFILWVFFLYINNVIITKISAIGLSTRALVTTCNSVVEQFPSRHRVLGSNLEIAREKKRSSRC